MFVLYLFNNKVRNLPQKKYSVFPQSIQNPDFASNVDKCPLKHKIHCNSFIFHLSLPLHVFLPHYFVVLKHPIFPRRKFLKKQVIQDFYLTSRVNSSFQNCLPCLSSQDL